MRVPASRNPSVRSWIFRHRLRLRAIYAPRPALLPAPLPKKEGRSGQGFVIVERHGPHTILLRPSGPARQKPAA